MTRIVLDASVAAKWVLPREQTLVDEALDLLKSSSDLQLDFVVPESFWGELGNVMWKAVRRGRWSAADALDAMTTFPKTDIETVALAGLFDDALQIAISYDRSFYDSLYVALALQTNLEMITADERLANALGARFPVRWLGSFSIT